ncbi:MAG: serine/threonine protein kinase [Bryobacterales bacterium]|nr:serine/threonine protein kinase [Bryobacterales bacterium]
MKEILAGAVDLPEWQRQQYVDGATGDRAVRDEVLSLLRAGAEATADGEGLVLAGRYRVVRKLGEGGFGIVFLAEDSRTYGQLVVVKVLRHVSASAWHERKFEEEAKALAQLRHPGVVGLLGTGRLEKGTPFEEGTPYLVMQYVEGIPLEELIRGGPVALEVAADLVRQIGGALDAAHAARILHRDLKPANIMLQPLAGGEYHVKLIDFGIAGLLAADGSGAVTRTLVGTEAYMAPEQWDGQLGKASDIYAFGVVAYEILTGVLPFEADNELRRMFLRRDGEWKRAKTIRPEIPGETDELIAAALAVDARRRPENAAEFGRRLAQTLLEGGGKRGGQRRVLVGLLGLVSMAGAWVAFRGWEGQAPAPVMRGAAERARFSFTIVGRDGGRRQVRDRLALGRSEGFRLEVRAGKDGFLYVYSEQRGKAPLVALFPSPTANRGLSFLKAGQSFTIPESSWFEAERGRNVLWLIWGAKPMVELEPASLGLSEAREVVAASQREAVRKLLGRLRAGVEFVEGKGEATVEGPGEGFAWAVEVAVE